MHFWGEVNKPGLHFVPVDTAFIDGISMAGGPKSSSRLENVRLMRKTEKKLDTHMFDLAQGGSDSAHYFVLKSGDAVFVERSTKLADRTYYTSLVSVLVSVLSAVILYRTIKNDPTALKGLGVNF